jgi:hypothetical protein
VNAPLRLVRSVLAWPVESQQGSRRNALVASTALTQRRRERDEVEEFLAARELAALSTTGQEYSARRDVI